MKTSRELGKNERTMNGGNGVRWFLTKKVILLGAATIALTATIVFAVRHSMGPSANGDQAELFADGDGEGNLDADSRQDGVVTRIRDKEEIAATLIRGEITFARAAERYRELDDPEHSGLTALRARFPWSSIEELYHRQVLGFVRGARRLYPEPVARLVPRLEGELFRRFPPRVAPAFGPPFNVQTTIGPKAGDPRLAGRPNR
jgi:hypothetical protein